MLGAASEDLGAPYQPWIQVLFHYVDHTPQAALEQHVERHGGVLARMITSLKMPVPDAPAAREFDADTERYLLFGAAAGLLLAGAEQHPLALVLDGLQGADRGASAGQPARGPPPSGVGRVSR